MRVLIAGSRRASERLPGLARDLGRFIGRLGAGDVILLRSPMHGSPGRFETAVSILAAGAGVPYEWREPLTSVPVGDPDEGTPIAGRESVHQRDYRMVREADLVIVVTTSEQVGDETSGTFKLVDKAMQERVPVYAYAVDDGGEVAEVGSHDPKALFASVVPYQ